MAPSDYVRSREIASQGHGELFATLVDGRPYLPNLVVDPSDVASVTRASLTFVILSTRVAAAAGAGDVDAGGRLAARDTLIETTKALATPAEWESTLAEATASIKCTRVTGGITNALYRVSGFGALGAAIAPACASPGGEGLDAISLVDFDSVLVRIFGAEGMINRDVETSTYSALCDAGVAYRHLGRFGNGRVEGWLDGYVALKSSNLTNSQTSLEIAKEMARLHCLFEVPAGELRDHHFGSELGVTSVGLWDQLTGWMAQAKGYSEFKTPRDTERARELGLDGIELEVRKFVGAFSSCHSEGENGGGSTTMSVCENGARNRRIGGGVVFCHNDLLAANIMQHPETNRIQLIDFEYGGTNYVAFDIANHFNEHAGGTSPEENGQTDYSKFPNMEQQMSFCVGYIRTVRLLGKMESDLTEPGENEDVGKEAKELLNQVRDFILVNHLYWGLWAVNQAAEEGCKEFDYIFYAANRFKEFYAKKAEWEEAPLVETKTSDNDKLQF